MNSAQELPPSGDYQRMTRAIAYLHANAGAQPPLDAVAAHVGLSPHHFQRLFSRWAGVSPKRYLQLLTVERARALLREPLPLLEVADAIGLSSTSRLHDHFIQLEAVTPDEARRGGAGLIIHHGRHPSAFGDLWIAVSPRGICRLDFCDEESDERWLARLRSAWPAAELRRDPPLTAAVAQRLFTAATEATGPLSLHVRGTNFQVNVWRALLRIPPGRLVSYGTLARAVGAPGAARAVGRAVGDNPVAFLIPCHRVIQQNGTLGGYRWGVERKQAMHVWEAARAEAAAATGLAEGTGSVLEGK